MNIARRYRLFLVSCLLCGVVANAQQEDDDAGRLLVKDFLNNVNTMSGRFEQQLVDASNAIIEESSGTLDIRRPGQFRWSYKTPYEQMLIADGVNIWSYDVDLEQVTVKGQSDALASTPAILLGGSSDVLDDFDYVGSVSDRGTLWVRLRPKDTDSGFNMVELGFTDGELTRMLFADNLEQTTLIALLDVRFNEPIDDRQFAFSPPAGVDLVGEPVPESPADL
ncbi:MAG: outer membrane lipoprotein chaperone LolA [Woeseiaceae bacterium]